MVVLWCKRVCVCDRVLFRLTAESFVNSSFLRIDPARSCVWLSATAGSALGLKSMCWFLAIPIWIAPSWERKSDTVCSPFAPSGDTNPVNELSLCFVIFCSPCSFFFSFLVFWTVHASFSWSRQSSSMFHDLFLWGKNPRRFRLSLWHKYKLFSAIQWTTLNTRFGSVLCTMRVLGCLFFFGDCTVGPLLMDVSTYEFFRLRSNFWNELNSWVEVPLYL